MSLAARLLTGPESAAMLQAALTGEPDGTVPGFGSRVDQVHDRPGAEVSATYQVSYLQGGRTVTDHLVATTAEVRTAATVERDGLTVRVWRHPADPRLPGLAGACTPEVLAGWLPGAPSDTGATADDVPERTGPTAAIPAGTGADVADPGTTPDAADPGTGPDVTDLLVYRPLRRAVLRTRRGGLTYFTKVVRPRHGDLLRQRHTLLAGLGPDVVAAPAPGVLVTAHAPGTSLAVALSAWQLGESTVAPDPAAALDLLDRLPPAAVDLPARPSWTDRVDFHTATAAATLPRHAEEIRQLGAQIEQLATAYPVGPVVPTHGDFHEGNIFCQDGRPTRMIDIDTVGPGRREDDLACLTAHLAVLPDLSPGHYPRGAEVADRYARTFEETTPMHPGAFRIRVAGVLLSLVAGSPPATALTRLDLARAWAWRATLPTLPGAGS